MKRLRIIFILIWTVFSPVQEVSACYMGDDDPDGDFISLFDQEMVDTCEYLPFLRTNNTYYHNYGRLIYSGNVKEWASYLKIKVEEANYLVMKASKNEIDTLLRNHMCANKYLTFADKVFCEKNHEALEYLSYAKYLEPYMCISLSEEVLEGYYDFTKIFWEGNWRDRKDFTADVLPYEDIMSHLKKKYKNLSDKELKLRYGYQIVRLAHYTRRYSDAVKYFDKYVKKLKYKPEMYYYALNQKAGAMRGMLYNSEREVSDKERISYLNDFLAVFKSSQDLKISVYNSLRIMKEFEFLFQSKDLIDKEGKICLHFLLGYQNFNNPLNEAKEIIKIDPNAIEARVLMAREINDLEREIHPHHLDYYYDEEEPYPDFCQESDAAKSAIDFAKSMTEKAKEKDFWNLATATLLSYNCQFDDAKKYLSKVEETDTRIKNTKRALQILIDIEEPNKMTREMANSILQKYGYDLQYNSWYWWRWLWGQRFHNSGDTIIGTLLCDEEINNIDLCNRFIDFIKKEDKNDFEKWVIWVQNLQLNELKFKKAILFLNERRGSDNLVDIASIDSAYHLLKELKNKSEVEWKCAFCSNIRGFNYYDKEEQNDFHYDYIKEILGTLPAEKTPLLTYLEYIKELNKTVQQSPNKNKAAKAAFLLGNFYFNLSDEGYYRGRSIFASSVYDAYSYYLKGFSLAKDKELKARLTFALAKTTHQGIQHYLGEYFHLDYGPYYHVDDVTSDIDYYELLSDMENTKYYKEVVSKCKYFELYLNN